MSQFQSKITITLANSDGRTTTHEAVLYMPVGPLERLVTLFISTVLSLSEAWDTRHLMTSSPITSPTTPPITPEGTSNG